MGIYLYNNEQINKIKEASIITAKVLDEIEKIIDIGITTKDIDALARNLIKSNGGEPAFLNYKGFPASVCTSRNEVVVHGIPNKKEILKSGDIIGVDMGVLYNGFYGDTARTFQVGSIDNNASLLLKATKDSLYAGIQKCIVGNRISDISNAIETHVTKYGYCPVRDYVGHGIGLNLHEEPAIPNYGEPGKGPRIKNGMVLAIETMINLGTGMVDLYDDGWTVVTRDRKLSCHFEHTVAVIQGKAEILTKGNIFN
ncbi:MAG: type I methionyl aminopeptidase [Spirochaetota bacterium]|nr:type I methionyl aminopeptidase [Spirochaetota bacterium]